MNGDGRHWAGTLRDPLLLRWRLGRLFRKWPGPEAYEPHKLPYLKTHNLKTLTPRPSIAGKASDFIELPDAVPAAPLLLDLPGCTIRLSPSDPGQLFRQVAGSPAREMAHSFAWLELLPNIDPAWVAVLWRAWVEAYEPIKPDRPEHQPRVAARRAVAILDYARRAGLPGPREATLALLAAHADLIRDRLDWYGPAATDSKIIIEGHALYRLGLELGLAWAADMGFAILTEEAKRQIRPAGILGEDSTARHLMVTRAYADSWLVALRKNPGDAPALESIVRRLLAAIGPLVLPGGMAIIGEVPVWNPPSHFAGLAPGSDMQAGWTGLLKLEERERLGILRDACHLSDLDQLAEDGWLRLDAAGWSGLWHVAGWVSAHGHSDLGAPEIHYGSTPVFIDPGGTDPFAPERAALWRSAVGHGGITLDGQDIYPRERACYDATFRAKAGGRQPFATPEYDGVSLNAFGPSPMAGMQEIKRRWRFEPQGMTIEDRVMGTGRYALVRRLVTPWPVVRAEDGSAIIEAGPVRVSVRSDTRLTLRTGRRQDAAGREWPTGLITFAIDRAPLPWHGRIDIRIL